MNSLNEKNFRTIASNNLRLVFRISHLYADIVLITLILSIAVYVNAQNVAINTTGNSTDASAMLDIASTSKGFLAPRMTTIQRTAISSPANGLLVFDTNTKSYWYFSTTWKELNNGASALTFPVDETHPYNSRLFSIINNGVDPGRVAIYGSTTTGSPDSTPGYPVTQKKYHLSLNFRAVTTDSFFVFR